MSVMHHMYVCKNAAFEVPSTKSRTTGTRAAIPTNYEDAFNFVGGSGKQRTVCNNTVVSTNIPSLAYGVASVVQISLHGHVVVQFRDDGDVCIDSCGYRTNTTKDRINRCLGDRGRVFQKNHEWFFQAKYGFVIPFRDGLLVKEAV